MKIAKRGARKPKGIADAVNVCFGKPPSLQVSSTGSGSGIRFGYESTVDGSMVWEDAYAGAKRIKALADEAFESINGEPAPAKPLKVAIVGAAPSSRGLAPCSDPEWTIWGCSPSNRDKIERIDAWFELHAITDFELPQHVQWTPAYKEWLRTRNHPVYMQTEGNAFCPGAVRFPRDEIVAHFGGDPSLFYTSSIAWMIACAIYSGATDIGIYGVDMTAGGEYEYERPGCQFWIREAKLRGVTVHIPPQSDLAAPIPQYGYGDADPSVFKIKVHRAEIRDRLEKLNNERAQLANRVQHIDTEKAHLAGAHEQSIYMSRTFLAWSGPDV